MKRLLTAFMAACLFLTAGCGAGTAPSAAEDVPAPSAAASSMDETASSGTDCLLGDADLYKRPVHL